MDNVTHSLLGAVLAKTRLGRASPFAVPALVVAANLPDFENVVQVFYDHTTRMVQHRGITHGVVGVPVLAVLLALVVRGLEKWLRPGAPGSFWRLLGGVVLATATHPLLDWLNTYGLRPWLPFSGRWYYGDLVYIVDPWLWLLLGGAVALAGRRTRAGSVALGVLALLLTAVIMRNAHLGPAVLQYAWPAVVALLVLGRWRGVGQMRGEPIAVAALAAGVAYIGFLGWAGHRAWRMSEAVLADALPAGETIIAHTTSPQPANPLRWEIVAETQVAVYRHTFSITQRPGGVVRLPKRLDDPLVQRALETPEGRAWRLFARHPVAAVAAGSRARHVYLMDARYPMLSGHGFATVVIDEPAATSAPQAP